MLSIFFFPFVMFPARKKAPSEKIAADEEDEDMKVNC